MGFDNTLGTDPLVTIYPLIIYVLMLLSHPVLFLPSPQNIEILIYEFDCTF